MIKQVNLKVTKTNANFRSFKFVKVDYKYVHVEQINIKINRIAMSYL